MLETTQQHLSQIEKGIRPLSLDQRRQIVARLGIAPEELGLPSGQARQLVAADDANPEIGASRMRWREERRWLNTHRSELARLAVGLYRRSAGSRGRPRSPRPPARVSRSRAVRFSPPRARSAPRRPGTARG